MTTGTLYDSATIDSIRESMEKLPDRPTTRLSTRELVEQLRPALLAKRQQGYTYKALAEFLNQHGVKISEKTLINYLKPAAKRKPRSRRKMPPSDETEPPKVVAADSSQDATIPPSEAVILPPRKPNHAGFNEDV